MKKLEIKIGEEITFDELGRVMNLEAGLFDYFSFEKEQIRSIDNYDGDQGWVVEFELIDKTDLTYTSKIRIVDIYKI